MILTMSGQEPEDMDIAYMALEGLDNLLHRNHYVDHQDNSDLKVRDDKDLNRVNSTEEEKNYQETLERIWTSAVS